MAFLEMDCSSRQAPAFEGRLTSVQVGELCFNQVEASTQDVFRTRAGIARSARHPFYLITQRETVWHVRQGGHRVGLRPGDAVLVDSAQTYELHFPTSVEVMSIQMSRTWVDEIAAANQNAVMLPYPIWREAFISDADAALARRAFDQLNLQPYRTFTEPVVLQSEMAAKPLGKSYLLCTEDTAMPHSLPWHPRLSERLGLYRLAACPGSHELCFTDPALLARRIEEAGRD